MAIAAVTSGATATSEGRLTLVEPAQVTIDFDDLYARYHRRVRGFVRRRIADPHLVDDVVQEVFLRAFRSLDTVDPDREVWPWLSKVADHASIDALRRRRPTEEIREAVVDGLSALARPSDDPAERYTAMERQEGMATAMRAVCERQRRMLMLREAEGWRYEDIAEFEGITLDALKSALKRARKTFRDAYAAVADERGLWGAALGPLYGVGRRMRSALSRAEVQCATQLSGLTSSLSSNVASLMVAAGIATAAMGTGGVSLDPSLTSADMAKPASTSAATVGSSSGATASSPLDDVRTPDGRRIAFNMRSDQLTGTQAAGATPSTEVTKDDEAVEVITAVTSNVPGQIPDAPTTSEFYVSCTDSTGAVVCDAVEATPDPS